jgi:SLT domain-containing protein
MKNFHKFYNKVDALANSKEVKPSSSAKGLAARSTPSTAKNNADSQDIFNQVAEYIAAIRKTKKEIMNGKS